MVILTRWFPFDNYASAYAWVSMGSAMGCIVGAPLSVALLSMDGLLGLAGWQWLFLVEGMPSVLLGVALWFRLPQGPSDPACTWLTPADKARLQRRLEESAARRGAGVEGRADSGSFWAGRADAA